MYILVMSFSKQADGTCLQWAAIPLSLLGKLQGFCCCYCCPCGLVCFCFCFFTIHILFIS